MTKNELAYLTANDWTLITDKAKRQAFEKDRPLIREGLSVTTLFILRSGIARVERINGKGPLTVATLGPGDICGEMAFVEKSTASASVVADTSLEADAIDAGVLSTLFETFPHLASRFYRSLAVVLSRRLRATSAQLSRK